MKTVTQAFKNNIKLYGRELDSIISYDDNGDTVILGNAELNSVSPHYEGNILKSVMKQLDIDSNVDIPLNTEINYQFGVKVRTDTVVDYRDNYDYVDFGNYIVFKSEKQEDTGSYKLTCYDKMLNSMVDYEALQINYPINIREYISAICSHLNITFANSSDTFTNYDKPILNELYVDNDGKSLGYTFRDVLDELAEATASTICINEDNKLEVRYITNTNDSIDEEYLKDINVNFGEQYGPINTVVLSRSSGTDKISDSIPSNLPDDQKIAIEIVDNQIMNANNRDAFLPGILNRLYGLQYYVNDYSSTGIVYYDLCDRYNISIDNNNYSCVMLNDDVVVTQGLVENVHTDMPEVSETDYTKTDKTDRKINQTNLIVDKQQGIIDSLVSNTVYISDSVSGIGTIQLENAHEGQLYELSISGQMSLLFPQSQNGLYGHPVVPSDTLVPSNTLVPSSPVPYGNEIHYPSSELFTKSNALMVDDIEYPLNFGFLNYLNTEVYDEIQYHNGIYKVIRRVGINSQGEKYALDEEIVELTEPIDIEVKANSIIKMKSFDNAILSSTYLLDNVYTDSFATEVYVQSEIKQTADQINLEVSRKVGENEIISKINQTPEQITIQASKVNLTGYITATDLSGSGTTVINGANITTGTLSADRVSGGTLTGTTISGNTITGGTITGTEIKGSSFLGTHIGSVNLQIGTDADGYMSNDNSLELLYSNDNSKIIGIYGKYWNDANLKACYFSSAAQGYVFIGTRGIYASAFNNNSRAELKKDFELLDDAINIVKNADVYKYHWKEENEEQKKHIGLIIGEDYNTPDEFLGANGDSIDMYSMSSICLEAIKEQQQMIEDLKQRIEALERDDK